MGVKTFLCPYCGCVLVQPAIDGESAAVPCIACKGQIVLHQKKGGEVEVSHA